jgi:hypothetical protein
VEIWAVVAMLFVVDERKDCEVRRRDRCWWKALADLGSEGAAAQFVVGDNDEEGAACGADRTELLVPGRIAPPICP